MRRRRAWTVRVVGLAAVCAWGWAAGGAEQPAIPGGQLQIVDPSGASAGICPLKYTDVQADIAGFVGRVSVKQVFHNPTDQKIEAVYVFPLPQNAAVDEMVMVIGERRIVGQIKERGEAREIYERAKAAGHVASLLDQERPNIFTQSVANIEPGVEVAIEISYVETLKFEDGVFEWSFPMVVGPRYIPGGGSAQQPMATGHDTPEVPDGSRITPPVAPPGKRAGHDISLTVHIDAGIAIHDLKSVLHEVTVINDAAGRATVTLKNETEIPNRDFILHYSLATDAISDVFLLHQDERGQFFTLVLQPPQRVVPQQIVPRELVFVLDTSGSMMGQPITKAKETMKRLIDTMQPVDTFNVITFSGDTRILWLQPQPANAQNIKAAQAFLDSHSGAGGTEMMKAINAALVQTAPRVEPGRSPAVRLVCFMTDGYVGNDMAIIDAVKKNAGTTRVFSFGIGNSVNRFLLDNMAYAGRGEVEYVTLASAEGDMDAAARRFAERITAPVLTDIAIDWGTLAVSDVYPTQIPDLFSVKPVVVYGRLNGAAAGTIKLSGHAGDGPYEDTITVAAPQTPPDHRAIPSLWARAKVDDLMMRDFAAAQSGQFPEELKKQVIALGLEYRLMTQYTSFVAVEEMTVTAGGVPVKINVPVEMPEGVSYEGVFGEGKLGVAAGAPAATPGRVVTKSAGDVMAKKETGRSFPRKGGGRGAGAVGGGVVREQQDTATAPEERQARSEVPVQELMRTKLADALQGLAAKVEKEGRDGTLAVGRMQVTQYRVDVLIFLRDASEQTVAALRELGFVASGESKAVTMVAGTIDVRKLAELAKLDAVLKVKPVVEP